MMLKRKLDPELASEEDLDFSLKDNSKDRTAVLAIAYHNMGVE